MITIRCSCCCCCRWPANRLPAKSVSPFGQSAGSSCYRRWWQRNPVARLANASSGQRSLSTASLASSAKRQDNNKQALDRNHGLASERASEQTNKHLRGRTHIISIAASGRLFPSPKASRSSPSFFLSRLALFVLKSLVFVLGRGCSSLVAEHQGEWPQLTGQRGQDLSPTVDAKCCPCASLRKSADLILSILFSLPSSSFHLIGSPEIVVGTTNTNIATIFQLLDQ